MEWVWCDWNRAKGDHYVTILIGYQPFPSRLVVIDMSTKTRDVLIFISYYIRRSVAKTNPTPYDWTQPPTAPSWPELFVAGSFQTASARGDGCAVWHEHDVVDDDYDEYDEWLLIKQISKKITVQLRLKYWPVYNGIRTSPLTFSLGHFPPNYHYLHVNFKKLTR